MVLRLILSNTDNLSRYLQGEQMDVITAKKTADAVVKTLSNCRNEESFTLMWSHADVIAQKIKIGIEGTQFTFRDAKVPRTRPSRRLQSLTGETPAAANDSSQQTAKDHFRTTVSNTSIDKVVSELQSRFEGNDQEVLCTLGEIVFSRSPSIDNIKISELLWTPVLSRYGDENLTSWKNHLAHLWPTSFIRANYVQLPQQNFSRTPMCESTSTLISWAAGVGNLI